MYDINIRFCQQINKFYISFCLSMRWYVGLQTPIDFEVTKSKVEVTVTVFAKTISVCPSRCGFQALSLPVLQISFWGLAYTLPMLIFRQLLISRYPGQRSSDRCCENHFRPSVTLWFPIIILSVLQISYCEFEDKHSCYICRHLLIFRSPGQRSRQQWLVFFWKPFPVIIFVSFTDIFLRLCTHIYLCWSSDTYWFRGHQVKSQHCSDQLFSSTLATRFLQPELMDIVPRTETCSAFLQMLCV